MIATPTFTPRPEAPFRCSHHRTAWAAWKSSSTTPMPAPGPYRSRPAGRPTLDEEAHSADCGFEVFGRSSAGDKPVWFRRITSSTMGARPQRLDSDWTISLKYAQAVVHVGSDRPLRKPLVRLCAARTAQTRGGRFYARPSAESSSMVRSCTTTVQCRTSAGPRHTGLVTISATMARQPTIGPPQSSPHG